MGADSRHPAVVQHHDLVRVPYGTGPLGYKDHRHIFCFPADSLPERRVGRKIQGAGAVIQNQKLRLSYQRPGDGQPLLLAAGKVLPSLIDNGIVFFRQGVYKFRGLGNG